MTHRAGLPPPMSERKPEPIDRIWYFALPAFYLLMSLYGLFASLFPITAVASVQGFDRAAVFGGLICLSGVFLLVGCYFSIFRQRPHVEFFATLVFLLLMCVYTEALYHATTTHESGSRPGSTFLPVLFSVFPFTRVLAILRGGRMRWAQRFMSRFIR